MASRFWRAAHAGLAASAFFTSAGAGSAQTAHPGASPTVPLPPLPPPTASDPVAATPPPPSPAEPAAPSKDDCSKKKECRCDGSSCSSSGTTCGRCGSCGSCCTCAHKAWDGTVWGVRGSFTSVDGPERVRAGGVMFFGQSEGWRTDEGSIFTMRGASALSLGGGSGGVEGSLSAAFTLGLRAPLGDTHGPFARVGLGGELLGNSKFYYSHIDLPLGEVGYQYVHDRTVLELGARATPILTGRYNTGDTSRRELGTSFAWGGYLAVHTRYGRLDGSFTRVEAHHTDPGTPVDVARGMACVYFAETVALCADGMWLRGDQQPVGVVTAGPPPGTMAESIYAGATLGFVTF